MWIGVFSSLNNFDNLQINQISSSTTILRSNCAGNTILQYYIPLFVNSATPGWPHSMSRGCNELPRRKGLTPGRFDILGNSGAIARWGAVKYLMASRVLQVSSKFVRYMCSSRNLHALIETRGIYTATDGAACKINICRDVKTIATTLPFFFLRLGLAKPKEKQCSAWRRKKIDEFESSRENAIQSEHFVSRSHRLHS